MPRTAILARSTALALCLPAAAALADVTSAEVWADWKSYMTSAGYTVNAVEQTSRGTVTVTELNLDVPLGETPADGTARVTMGSLRFVETRDGGVSVELPARTLVRVNVTNADDAPVDMTLAFDQTEPVMTVTGDPGELTYTYAAPSAGFFLSALSVDGAPVAEDVAAFSVDLKALSYVSTSVVDVDMRSVQQTMDVGSIGYDISFDDPEGQGSVKLVGAMQGLAFGGGGDLPVAADTQDMNAMLNAGFGFDGTFTSTSGNYDLSFNGPDGSGTANSTSQGGEINIAMGGDGLLYDVAANEVAMNILITEFPLPLSFSASQIATSVLMPLQKAVDPQDFSLGVALRDFTMSDVIWGLFDPAGQLPRDPATLLVNLSGQARVLFDFLDPRQAAVLDETGAVPGELNALTLNALEIDAAGAKLTGAGDFTFDNSDLVTFGGVPRPLGAVDLTLVGGNALLDKLVGLGLVPQEQATGARLMMGLFAVPGATPDTLTSRIEVNPEGHVLANGQRIR